MGTIRMEESKEGKVLVAGGRLTIQDASALKDLLVEAYEAGDTLVLDLSQVDGLDLACAQVLLSARDTFEEANKTMRLAGDLPEGVLRSFNDMAIEPLGDHSGRGRES